MYTHRSNMLHAMITVMPDALALGCGSTMLMIVPMVGGLGGGGRWGACWGAGREGGGV
jgi:hypothetical protein